MKSDKPIFLLLIFLIGLILLGKFLYLTRIPGNQDEFFFLSWVHQYLNGRLTGAFQTFHVHFFTWINMAGTNEMDQVISGRKILTVLLAATCCFFYFAWRAVVSKTAALFSILCYLCLFFTLYNCAALRSDSLSLFLYSVCIYCILRHEDKIAGCAIGGACMAAALLITIKSAVFLPGIVIIFVIRFFQKKRSFKKTFYCQSAFLIGLCISGVLLFHFHVKTLDRPLAASIEKPAQSLTKTTIKTKDFSKKTRSSYSIFFSHNKIFPRWQAFVVSVKMDLLIWILIMAGTCMTIWKAAGGDDRTNQLTILILAAPILTFLVYRNANAYYYAFIMPGVMLLAGSLLDHLSRTDIRRSVYNMVVCCLALLIFFHAAVLGTNVYHHLKTDVQEQTLRVVHSIFAEPVPYIDGCGMVSSFPKAGFFMSSAGMRGYVRNNRPIFKSILLKQQPKFVLVNVPHLDLNAEVPPESAEGFKLLPQDWDTLRDNYVHHWGHIWIAGKKINPGGSSQAIGILIPGFYTNSSRAPVIIDGNQLESDAFIFLKKGQHQVTSLEPGNEIILKFGKTLPVPNEMPIDEPLFAGAFL